MSAGVHRCLQVYTVFQVSAFVDALYKLHEKKDTESKDKLFEEDSTESINLVVGSIKLPSDKRRQTIKM